MGKLVEHSVFHDAIVPLVPQIGDWLKDADPDVQSAGASTMGQLVEHGKAYHPLRPEAEPLSVVFHDAIKHSGFVPHVFELLTDDDWLSENPAQLPWASLSKIVGHASLCTLWRD
ncbi:hypothetical protein C8R44DRAFT_761811 [Mycena epipterygia]|nr:hypothetical protein C8R44DRAFT_761811 [Mycena epipterygia]